MKLFIKAGCPWCEEAEEWLHRQGLEYEVVDVLKDAAAYEEMRRISGQSRAPTLLMPDGAVLADFGTEELEDFLKECGRSGELN